MSEWTNRLGDSASLITCKIAPFRHWVRPSPNRKVQTDQDAPFAPLAPFGTKGESAVRRINLRPGCRSMASVDTDLPCGHNLDRGRRAPDNLEAELGGELKTVDRQALDPDSWGLGRERTKTRARIELSGCVPNS